MSILDKTILNMKDYQIFEDKKSYEKKFSDLGWRSSKNRNFKESTWIITWRKSVGNMWRWIYNVDYIGERRWLDGTVQPQ